jgi:peptidoglycan hydrolase-like protein with peptidoglycan-binding domain
VIPRLVLFAATALTLLASATPAHASTLPVVNMEAVGIAAFVEGSRGNQPTIGDDESTKLIQAALTAKGFKVKIDGRYSRATTAAYIKYQRSLGYKGIDANGIPGYESLIQLGQGHFSVANVVQIGSRHDHYGSKRVNTRTSLMLAAADSTLPWKIKVTQGSYCVLEKSGCAKASAGTHDGGGSIDIKASSLSKTQRWRTVQALRRVGFAAWLRLPSQCGGCWPTHIHAVAIGDTDMWQKNKKYTNRDQVGDYFVGRNGLRKHKKDNTPAKYRVPFITWEQYVRQAA